MSFLRRKKKCHCSWIWALAGALIFLGIVLDYTFGDIHDIQGSYATSFFAAGDFAVGVFAAGTFAVGIFSAGLFSLGVFSIGVFSIGLWTVGLFALGRYIHRLKK